MPPERRRAEYNEHLAEVVHDYVYGAIDDPADNPHDSAIDDGPET